MPEYCTPTSFGLEPQEVPAPFVAPALFLVMALVYRYSADFTYETLPDSCWGQDLVYVKAWGNRKVIFHLIGTSLHISIHPDLYNPYQSPTTKDVILDQFISRCFEVIVRGKNVGKLFKSRLRFLLDFKKANDEVCGH